MYLVQVLPIGSNLFSQELSYFCASEIEAGAVVQIPLRGKITYALCISSTPAGDLKQTVRASPFPIKKLSTPSPARILSRAYLRATFEIAKQHAVPWSVVLGAYVPTALLKRRGELPEVNDDSEERAVRYEALLYTQSPRERIAEYRRIVRESLARGLSMLILTPTVIEATLLAETLSRGIEGYVETLHSGLTEKKLTEAWKRIALSERPLLIIGTTLALSVPRLDIGTIVLERATSRAYRRDEYPNLNGAFSAEALAEAVGARFIIAATIPPVSASFRRAQGDIGDYGITATRLAGPTPIIVDLRANKKEKGTWKPLAPATLDALAKVPPSSHVLVLAARRGLSPLTVCDDCGSVLACKTCGRQLVLHADEPQLREASRQFMCHHCGTTESASVRCSSCNGWRLITLGIAIDSVAKTVAESLPDRRMFVISQDKGTASERAKLLAQWRNLGGILVGTEMVVPHLGEKVDHIVVASVDSLLSIPEYSASERVITLLAELRAKAQSSYVIQTRDPNHRVIKAIESGMFSSYVKEEVEDRIRYAYPPAATLIRFTINAKPDAARKLAQEMLAALSHFSPQSLSEKPGKRGEVSIVLLLRLPHGVWVDQRLLRFIRSLPWPVTVDIDPLSIHR